MNELDPEEKAKVPMLSPGRIFLVLMIIAIVIEFVTIISYYVCPPVYDDYDVDEYFPGADASERGGMEYLTDDEVKEAGLACSELGHFDFSGESVMEDLYGILEEQGLEITDTDTSSFNQIYGDGGSWYETLLMLSLRVPGDESGYQRITISCDTATGALHEIDLFISDEDRVLDLTKALIGMLTEHSGSTGALSSVEMTDELEHSFERGENMYAVYGTEETGYMAVTVYCFEDGYSVYISRE